MIENISQVCVLTMFFFARTQRKEKGFNYEKTTKDKSSILDGT
jgi:hypothetical protein